MVRIPVSMMSDFVVQQPYTYVNEGDFNLESFSIEKDKEFFIPIIKEALQINPDLVLLAVPWSAPGWMKETNTLYGSSFKSSFTDIYALYLRKYLESYAREGINIQYLVPQNEPLHSANGYPTMSLSANDEAALVERLASEISSANLATKLVIYGHNWDNLDYARSILLRPGMQDMVYGVAFHCYAGDYRAPGQLAQEFPDIAILFEECSG